jgi:hypothetical protein
LKVITAWYILNTTLLLLHEIESGYEKEWEIIKLPGKITGFLLLHLPIILVMLYGLLEIEKLSKIGLLLGLILGIGGILPFLIHKVLVKKQGHFNLLLSNVIIYLNALSGGILVFWVVRNNFA